MTLTQITADRKAQMTADDPRQSALLGSARIRAARISGNPRHGQASVEMTLAMFGALLLFLASFKVFLWINERLIQRQVNYEHGVIGGKQNASSTDGYAGVVEPPNPLDLLNEGRR